MLELLEQNLPMLRAYFRLKAGRKLLAQESVSDLVQSVCSDVLSDMHGFEYRGEAEFRGWLVKRAWTKLSQRARYWGRSKRGPERTILPSQGADGDSFEWCHASFLTPSREAAGKEELRRFEEGLQSLPEEMRDAILLRRVVELPYSEIAAVLEKSEGAVRNLVYRGLARIAVGTEDS